MNAAESGVRYRDLTRPLAGSPELSAEDEAHLRLSVELYGRSNHRVSVRRTWNEWLGLLDEFVAREGHAMVPDNHIESGANLGGRVSSWRSQARTGALARLKIDQLSSRVGFSWSPLDEHHQLRLRALDAFIEREGHTRVGEAHVEQGVRLGVAVNYWRERKRRGLLPIAVATDVSARPTWVWDVFDSVYREHLRALDSFVAREGHARVPRAHIENDVKLGQAVSAWRTAFRKGIITPERRAELSSRAGWAWDAPSGAHTRKIAALDAFIEREGHARVPRAHTEGGVKLGEAVNNWRNRFSRGVLAGTVADDLSARRHWGWDADDLAYQENLRVLDAFVAREGHSRVKQSHVEDGVDLGVAVSNWRASFLRGTLPPDREADLVSRPGWVWAMHQANHVRNLAALDAFIAREGHARVPLWHVENGVKVGNTVGNWRRRHGAGDLKKSTVADLNSRAEWQWRIRK